MSDVIDFNLAAVTRDLARRPEIAHLAKVLSMLGPTRPVDEGIAPIYIYQAYRLIEKPELVQLLMITLEVTKKG